MRNKTIESHKNLIEEATKVFDKYPVEYSWLESTIMDEKLDFLKYPKIGLIKTKEDETKVKEIYESYLEKIARKELQEGKNQVK
jgi:hypothetical protein